MAEPECFEIERIYWYKFESIGADIGLSFVK